MLAATTGGQIGGCSQVIGQLTKHSQRAHSDVGVTGFESSPNRKSARVIKCTPAAPISQSTKAHQTPAFSNQSKGVKPMSTQVTRTTVRLAISTALLTTLTACGGGGSDAPDLPCGGGNPLSVSLTYEVNGVVVDGNRPITLARNVPVLATPRIVGLPSACNGATHLSVKTVLTSSLPNGVLIDAKTGVLSGTPTALGWYNLEMKLTIDGYLNSTQQTVDFIM
jgi:hypothetical protein